MGWAWLAILWQRENKEIPTGGTGEAMGEGHNGTVDIVGQLYIGGIGNRRDVWYQTGAPRQLQINRLGDGRKERRQRKY